MICGVECLNKFWSETQISSFEKAALIPFSYRSGSATAQYLMRGLEMHAAAAADMDASLEGLLEATARFNWPACFSE